MKELTIFLLCILVLSVIVNKMKENKDIVQKTSRITNESFYVRKLEDSQEAADILSKLCQRLETLTKSPLNNIILRPMVRAGTVNKKIDFFA